MYRNLNFFPIVDIRDERIEFLLHLSTSANEQQIRVCWSASLVPYSHSWKSVMLFPADIFQHMLADFWIKPR